MTDQKIAKAGTYQELSLEDWKALLSGYENIVLVANSAESDIPAMTRNLSTDTLFVFFNKVYKVLDEPFGRPALLACRSGMMGANIVHRREVPEVLKFFDPENFLGLVNIRIAPEEKFSPSEAFGTVSVRHLDLGPSLLPIYPQGKLPTTGFGLCVWLSQLDLPGRIVLTGFSSKRSERWKVFDVHDWTFEQVLLRMFSRHGRIDLLEGDISNPYAALHEHFPEFSQAEIALTANEVLSDRLLNLSSVVDRLMSVTKVLRFFDNSFRKVRPRTRKQRFLDRQQPEEK